MVEDPKIQKRLPVLELCDIAQQPVRELDHIQGCLTLDQSRSKPWIRRLERRGGDATYYATSKEVFP